MEIKYKKIEELIPYANNSRTHSQEQIQQIASSIKEFGFTNPILLDENNGIIAGHGRVMGAKLLNMKQVPTITLNGLSEAQIKAYVIADNKIALNAGWDEELLKVELEALQELDLNLDLLGFSAGELEDLNIGLEDDLSSVDGSKIDEVPEEVQKSFIKYGDIIEIGNHRLMCGDSTKKDDIKKLMNGEKADICFTDPDYAMDDDSWIDCVLNIALKEGNPFFIMASDQQQARYTSKIPNFRKFFAGIRTKALMISQYVPMNKLTLVSYFGERPSNFFINKRDYFTDVFEFERSASSNEKSEGHRHYKSVEVPTYFLEHYSKAGDLVIDLFAGSGTTLIASDMLGIRCNTCEINPINCELVIERYCNYISNYEIVVNGEKGDFEYFREKAKVAPLH